MGKSLPFRPRQKSSPETPRGFTEGRRAPRCTRARPPSRRTSAEPRDDAIYKHLLHLGVAGVRSSQAL